MLKCEEILTYTQIESLHGKKATEIIVAIQEVLTKFVTFNLARFCRWMQKFTNDPRFHKVILWSVSYGK